jgi:superfamily II DNA or RNA helicase
LVLPTGGGKTFTSVNWICRNILSNGIKVLWLAQSSYLLDQAADTFTQEVRNAIGRERINLRVVSSSTSHANSGTVSTTDDVLICTVQTAISAYSSNPLDGRGNVTATPFRKFIENCSDSQLFIVVDEAHHTPAYGCRTLLLSLREKIKNLYILGLTATPTHMDKRISGWLKDIYDQWICYEADQNILQEHKILAIPNYIEKNTGEEFDVDDGLYDRLVRKHKDLPENIIEELAKNQKRNNFIVSDYLNHRTEYGKTLIFADRWFQCEYIVEKLNEQLGAKKVGAVYTVVSGQDPAYHEGTGRHNDETNRQVMQDFKDGKLDVVVNVRMLTEGVDVPDVKTVMVTRQTTSNILLTQMIGRALRGEKAGGGTNKDYANLVFFHDTWKRLISWANIQTGGTEGTHTPAQGRNPMDLVSIQLVKLAAADIEYRGFEDAPYLTFIPVGFFGCEYTVAIADGAEEEFVSFAESILAYEFNKIRYDTLLDFLSHESPKKLAQYAAENLTDDDLNAKAEELAPRFFNMEKDDFDGLLVDNITKLIRHVAQNGVKPEFLDFRERDLYDLDKIAEDLLKTPPLDTDIILTNRFNDDITLLKMSCNM